MLDIPRLFTAVAEWSACVIYISFFRKRTGKAALYPLILLWLGVICGWQIAAGIFPLILWPLGMTGAAALMILCIYSCCKVKIAEAACWGLAAFIVAEFIASVQWQLYYYFYVKFEFAQTLWFELLFCFIIYSLCLLLEWRFDKKFFPHRAESYNSYKNLIVVVIIVVLCFVGSNLNFLYDTDDLSVEITEKIFEIRTLVDLCGIVLLYTYFMIQERTLKDDELRNMQDILDKEYRNYCLFKENNETLNRHYHDLKHQLDVLLTMEDDAKRAEYLKEVQHSLKVRQSQNKTGNEVMDTVLTSKCLDCVNADITFTVVADGALLSFMSVMDLCSVLGNSIDNAIESVSKIEDREKRVIQLALFSQKDIVVYRITNYYEQAPVYVNNQIVTAKNDRSNHGYGLKSIKYITEKYGGNMKIDTEDNWFTICLIFPR